jgi:hypothetical protein
LSSAAREDREMISILKVGAPCEITVVDGGGEVGG